MWFLRIDNFNVIIHTTGVVDMEKYKIIRAENEGFYQWLVLKKLNSGAGETEYKQLYSNAGFFKVGDIISRYLGFNGSVIAESYNLGNYRIIDFCDYVPKNDYEIKHFYADLDFCDKVRLKLDVARSLYSRGVWPSLSAKKNLRTLLMKTKTSEKVR